MKENTKPTQDEKVSYLAAHWGQKVLFEIASEKIVENYPEYWACTEKIFEMQYLELTPLSDITDEDLAAITVCIPEYITENGYFNPYDQKFHYWVLPASDYLRSKGYALPWMGYSVEQLISFGWLKLKQKFEHNG